jgi:hypothetical protein
MRALSDGSPRVEYAAADMVPYAPLRRDLKTSLPAYHGGGVVRRRRAEKQSKGFFTSRIKSAFGVYTQTCST